jgi:hypothetical protein
MLCGHLTSDPSAFCKTVKSHVDMATVYCLRACSVQCLGYWFGIDWNPRLGWASGCWHPSESHPAMLVLHDSAASLCVLSAPTLRVQLFSKVPAHAPPGYGGRSTNLQLDRAHLLSCLCDGRWPGVACATSLRDANTRYHGPAEDLMPLIMSLVTSSMIRRILFNSLSTCFLPAVLPNRNGLGSLKGSPARRVSETAHRPFDVTKCANGSIGDICLAIHVRLFSPRHGRTLLSPRALISGLSPIHLTSKKLSGSDGALEEHRRAL